VTFAKVPRAGRLDVMSPSRSHQSLNTAATAHWPRISQTIKLGARSLPRRKSKPDRRPRIGAGSAFDGDSLAPAACPGTGCGLGNDQITHELSGTRVIRSPKVTANVGASYDHELAGGKLSLTGNYFYTSKFFWVVGAHIAQPSYSLVNATAAWSPADNRYRIAIWGPEPGEQGLRHLQQPQCPGRVPVLCCSPGDRVHLGLQLLAPLRGRRPRGLSFAIREQQRSS
jgi:hypothetical protein